MAAGDLMRPTDPDECAAYLEGVAERVRRETAAQGLPEFIEDEATLDAVAAIVRNARRQARARQTRGAA